jgi:hypothetical protein
MNLVNNARVKRTRLIVVRPKENDTETLAELRVFLAQLRMPTRFDIAMIGKKPTERLCIERANTGDVSQTVTLNNFAVSKPQRHVRDFDGHAERLREQMVKVYAAHTADNITFLLVIDSPYILQVVNQFCVGGSGEAICKSSKLQRGEAVILLGRDPYLWTAGMYAVQRPAMVGAL